MVYGVWFMVYGVWCMVYGYVLWSVVHGVLCMEFVELKDAARDDEFVACNGGGGRVQGSEFEALG